VRWQFNETTGVIAPDTSGNGRHGDVNDTTEPNWVDDATRDWCLDFNDGDFVIDNDANTYMNGLRGLTVALWVKSNVTGTDNGFLIFEDPAGNDGRGYRYDSSGSSDGGTTNKAGVHYPLDSPADLYEDEAELSRYVNFKDYALVAERWLDEDMFP